MLTLVQILLIPLFCGMALMYDIEFKTKLNRFKPRIKLNQNIFDK